MECLTAVGNGVVGKIFEYTVEPVGHRLSYLFHYKCNIQNLHTQMRNLEAAKDSLHGEVVAEERRGKEVESMVQNWLTDVDKITRQAKEFLDDERHRKIKCLNGFCPNPMLRYRLGRKSTKLEQVMLQLYEKREYAKIAHEVVPKDSWAIPSEGYEAIESRTETVNKIMEELRNSSTNMIGVWGFGGVGKTTLVREVFRQATEEALFLDVVKVLNVTENPQLEKIQKEIAHTLGLEVDDSETLEVRAPKLFERILNKKTLVIFDDVWGSIDLEAMGIPRVSNCKILLTSRSRGVLSSMGTQKEFLLGTLGETETWSLFEKKAGEVVKDPAIRIVANEVAKKCGGLPVLVVTVASALKRRNKPHAWKNALKRLKGLDKEKLEEKAYMGLEWSYNQLDNKELKSLFLLHGILGGGDTSFHKLFNYALGLGLFKRFDTVEEAWNALISMVEELKDACLLLDGKDDTCVRMHDIVHHVAILIASRDRQVLYEGDLLKKWEDNKDYFTKCNAISLPCRDTVTKLPEVLQFREIEMFYAYTSKDELLEIPNNFFEGMKMLRVLGLENLCVPSLPSSLVVLKNLRALCLDFCVLEDISLIGQLSKLEILSLQKSHVKQLPKEIEQLTSLRLLDLTDCSKLEVIPPNVISSLQNLEDLRVGGSFKQWEAEGGRSNASILELKQLSKLTSLDIHIQLDANTLPADLFSDKLERFQIWIGATWDRYRFKPMKTLKLKLAYNQLNQGLKMLLKRSEVLQLDGLDGVTDLVSQLDSDGFQQLKELKVQNGASSVTCIINSIKWSRSNSNAFPSLEMLDLYHLVSLENICYGELPNESFRRLRRIYLRRCHKLRTVFPFYIARSFLQLEEVDVDRCNIMEHIFAEEKEDSCNNDIVDPLELCQLLHLRLWRLPRLTGFSSKADKMDTEAKGIISLNEIDVGIPVQLFMNGKVVFPNLIKLSMSRIGGFKFLLSSSMARSLGQLKYLSIFKCQSMEEIVSTQEFSEKNTNHMFDKLQSLWLEDLPNLRRFCSGSYIEFPSLEDLKICWCNRLRTFIFDHAMPKSIAINEREIDESDLKEDLEIAAQYCLFDKKAGFPRLETLNIEGLIKVRIWHNQLAPNSLCRLESVKVTNCQCLINIFGPSIFERLNALDTLEISNCKSLEVVFEHGGIMNVKETQDISASTLLKFSDRHCQNLDSIKIRRCEKLKNIFPASVAKGLQQLRELVAVDCGLEEIIAKEEGLETVPQFVFPKATSVKFKNMPRLGSFYPRTHASRWPSLEDLTVTQCDKVEILVAEFSNVQEMGALCTPIKQPLFSVEKGAFPNLKVLKVGAMDICYGASPAEFFGKLKSMKFSCTPSSKQVVSLQSSEHPYWTFPHVRLLRLKETRKLPTGPVIPNLEVLEVLACSRLKYLESSAISFQNLTTLEVVACHRLKYLFTSSVVRTLMHLTVMTVANCMRMREIVEISEDDAGNEIAFSALQQLKLCYLQSLQDFCSESCFVKFPSLKSFYASNRLRLKINCLEWKISPELGGVDITEEKENHHGLHGRYTRYYRDHVTFGEEKHEDDDDSGGEDDVDDVNDGCGDDQGPPPTDNQEENQEILISDQGQSAPQTTLMLYKPLRFPFSDLKVGSETKDTTSAPTVPSLIPAKQDVQMQTSEIAGTSGQTSVPSTQESKLDRTLFMSSIRNSLRSTKNHLQTPEIRQAKQLIKSWLSKEVKDFDSSENMSDLYNVVCFLASKEQISSSALQTISDLIKDLRKDVSLYFSQQEDIVMSQYGIESDKKNREELEKIVSLCEDYEAQLKTRDEIIVNLETQLLDAKNKRSTIDSSIEQELAKAAPLYQKIEAFKPNIEEFDAAKHRFDATEGRVNCQWSATKKALQNLTL